MYYGTFRDGFKLAIELITYLYPDLGTPKLRFTAPMPEQIATTKITFISALV